MYIELEEAFLLEFFFFTSRRRHTRSLCDWSSDVCSSDLMSPELREPSIRPNDGQMGCNHPIWPSLGLIDGSRSSGDIKRTWANFRTQARQTQIGRASCRERE